MAFNKIGKIPTKIAIIGFKVRQVFLFGKK